MTDDILNNNDISFVSKNSISIPKIKLSLFYDNNDVSEILKSHIKNIIYTDYIDKHYDTLQVELFDDNALFQNDWYFTKGSKIKCNIQLENQVLNCGTFTIESLNAKFMPQYNTLSVYSVAVPYDIPIRNKNSNSFEKTHIRDIAQFFADKYNFKFICDNDRGIVIERIAQIETTDMKFLSDLAVKYGYIFKITDHTLTFLKIPEQNPIFDLDKSLISFLDINDISTKTSGYIEFFNPNKKNLDCIQIGKLNNNILQMQEKFNSRGEGQIILASELKRISKERKGTLSLAKPIGNFNAGADFNLKGFGVHDGTYRITKSIHRISGDKGWEVAGNFEQC